MVDIAERTHEILPDVALPLLCGGELRLRKLRSRRFLLFFWGSW